MFADTHLSRHIFHLAACFHLLQRYDHLRLAVLASRHSPAPFLNPKSYLVVCGFRGAGQWVACPFGLRPCITLTCGWPALAAIFWRQGGVRFQLILAFPSWEILVKFCNGCDLCTCASCVRSGIRGVRGRSCFVLAVRAQCAGRESSLKSSCR